MYESQVPVGATPEYMAGYYMVDALLVNIILWCFILIFILLSDLLSVNLCSQLQSASSFLPVMALAPQEKERIVDMA